jgi:ornithine carbamoyltransferase
MVSGIAARTYSHATVLEMAEHADVPVINALTDEEHPCQALADLLTLRERFGSLSGLRLVYLGEGNNIARSLAYSSVMTGIHFTCASPPGFELPEETLGRARALPGGGSVTQLVDQHEAVRGADVLYTDVWASMGFEDELEGRLEHFAPYQLNAALIAEAPADALVMHDLPAHRGQEITDEVIESPRSVVFDQAENRLHAQQAVLASLLGGANG